VNSVYLMVGVTAWGLFDVALLLALGMWLVRD